MSAGVHTTTDILHWWTADTFQLTPRQQNNQLLFIQKVSAASMNSILNPSVYQVKHGRFEVLHLWYRKQGIDKLVNEPKHESLFI